jgi:hypothetical protein
VPLAIAAAVFAFVLATTPPGFRAVTDSLFGSPRGINADAAAYALGAAASLAFIALLAAALLVFLVEIAMRRR